MLTIREELMRAMGATLEIDFYARLTRHVQEYFPAECSVLGEGGLKEMLTYQVGKARQHGIVTERDICKYVDLAFKFGKDFDVDPLHPWAAAILSNAEVGGSDRMRRLYLVGMANAAQA
jgi:hypothetical protein